MCKHCNSNFISKRGHGQDRKLRTGRESWFEGDFESGFHNKAINSEALQPTANPPRSNIIPSQGKDATPQYFSLSHSFILTHLLN